MRLSRRRIAGLCIAALMSFSMVAVAQTPAPTPAPVPPPSTAKERREDRQEKREDRQEKREDAKEKREDAKEKREDAKEKREDRQEKREDRRETRQARRQEHIKTMREKWGEVVNRPPVRNELRTHAQRMARLNHMRRLASDAGKTELVARIDKIIEKENARHQAAMDKFKAEGAKP